MNVSVVVPTRNRSTLLSMTLRSVLRQQQVELEVIVIDEASTDDTAAMLATLGDARVRVINHDRPLGVSAARNRGAAEAHAFQTEGGLHLERTLSALPRRRRRLRGCGAGANDQRDRVDSRHDISGSGRVVDEYNGFAGSQF